MNKKTALTLLATIPLALAGLAGCSTDSKTNTSTADSTEGIFIEKPVLDKYYKFANSVDREKNPNMYKLVLEAKLPSVDKYKGTLEELFPNESVVKGKIDKDVLDAAIINRSLFPNYTNQSRAFVYGMNHQNENHGYPFEGNKPISKKDGLKFFQKGSKVREYAKKVFDGKVSDTESLRFMQTVYTAPPFIKGAMKTVNGDKIVLNKKNPIMLTDIAPEDASIFYKVKDGEYIIGMNTKFTFQAEDKMLKSIVLSALYQITNKNCEKGVKYCVEKIGPMEGKDTVQIISSEPLHEGPESTEGE